MGSGSRIEVRFPTETLRFEQPDYMKARIREGTVLLCLLFEISLVKLVFQHKEESSTFVKTP
jgi:hypothetical protein